MTASPPRIFLLSPAHCGGRRAAMLLRDAAQFELARALRDEAGVPLGNVFSFLSGLYFRGKRAYAIHFGTPALGADAALVITTNRGLLPLDTLIDAHQLRAMGTDDIDPSNDVYRSALSASAAALTERRADCHFVLLGSVATGKYVDILLDRLGERLLFPQEFIGRGDMSRGGLMLRCVDANQELEYIPVAGAIRRGKRPPKLERRK